MDTSTSFFSDGGVVGTGPLAVGKMLRKRLDKAVHDKEQALVRRAAVLCACQCWQPRAAIVVLPPSQLTPPHPTPPVPLFHRRPSVTLA